MCSHYVTQQKKIMVAEQTTLAELEVLSKSTI